MPCASKAFMPVEGAVERGSVHAQQAGHLLDGAILLDQLARMRDLRGGEGRGRPELHAPPLGRLTASPGALDNQAAYI